jgi:hypothetical protein
MLRHHPIFEMLLLLLKSHIILSIIFIFPVLFSSLNSERLRHSFLDILNLEVFVLLLLFKAFELLVKGVNHSVVLSIMALLFHHTGHSFLLDEVFQCSPFGFVSSGILLILSINFLEEVLLL